MELPPYLEARIDRDARVWFFSDAHLGSDDSAWSKLHKERVLAFLERVRTEADVLVVLGDLFDFYFEYKTVVPACHLRVLAALEDLSRAGVSCYYTAGNHDFWLGKLFSAAFGVTVAPDALLLVRQGEVPVRVLAAHGDGMGQGDLGYKLLKKCFRSRFLIWMFRQLHPDWGWAIARRTSLLSRRYTAGLQAARAAQQQNLARDLLLAHPDLEAVILAHTHQPENRTFEHGRYLNPGDWCTHFTYIIWTSEGFELKKFEEA